MNAACLLRSELKGLLAWHQVQVEFASCTGYSGGRKQAIPLFHGVGQGTETADQELSQRFAGLKCLALFPTFLLAPLHPHFGQLWTAPTSAGAGTPGRSAASYDPRPVGRRGYPDQPEAHQSGLLADPTGRHGGRSATGGGGTVTGALIEKRPGPRSPGRCGNSIRGKAYW